MHTFLKDTQCAPWLGVSGLGPKVNFPDVSESCTEHASEEP